MHRSLSRSTVPALVALLLATLTLTSCSGSPSRSSDATTGTGLLSGVGRITSVPAKDRKTPLELSGTDLNGKQLDVSFYRGKVVVINIWGSWCGGCRGEADGLEAVAKRTEAHGVQFIGIDTRDPQLAQPRQFVKDHNISYPSFYDATGDMLLKFPSGLFDPQLIPTTVVLDRQGRPTSVAMTAISSDQLTQMITPIVAEK